jgi:hypothetical protein
MVYIRVSLHTYIFELCYMVVCSGCMCDIGILYTAYPTLHVICYAAFAIVAQYMFTHTSFMSDRTCSRLDIIVYYGYTFNAHTILCIFRHKIYVSNILDDTIRSNIHNSVISQLILYIDYRISNNSIIHHCIESTAYHVKT